MKKWTFFGGGTVYMRKNLKTTVDQQANVTWYQYVIGVKFPSTLEVIKFDDI